jgi:hypothetical protein
MLSSDYSFSAFKNKIWLKQKVFTVVSNAVLIIQNGQVNVRNVANGIA